MRATNVEILEKSGAARARMTNVAGKNRDFATDHYKSEHPAKMTHSIPDFVCRATIKNQEFFQDLESSSPRTKIKT